MYGFINRRGLCGEVVRAAKCPGESAGSGDGLCAASVRRRVVYKTLLFVKTMDRLSEFASCSEFGRDTRRELGDADRGGVCGRSPGVWRSRPSCEGTGIRSIAWRRVAPEEQGCIATGGVETARREGWRRLAVPVRQLGHRRNEGSALHTM